MLNSSSLDFKSYLLKPTCSPENGTDPEKVFESADPYFRWDGKNIQGVDASEGTYYYIMHASRRDSNGFIELIRQKN